MNVTDIYPAQPEQVSAADGKPVSVPQEKHCADDSEIIGQSILNAEAGMHRKSVFADESGILVAQVLDHTGEVIASYPSVDVIKRYHATMITEKA